MRAKSGFAIALLTVMGQWLPLLAQPLPSQAAMPPQATKCQASQPNLLVVAGGGSPESNEISLEKNVLFFQRSLQVLGFDPAIARFFFANGKDGRATVRYLDSRGQERYKVPQIPHLNGAATLNNVQTTLQQLAKANSNQPSFFYFTGHGYHYQNNYENNFFILWNNEILTVQRYASLLDQFPTQAPVVTMMPQCYSGGFANLIYVGGNPKNAIAPHHRCGFFATIKTRPSVGCTPEVNEADYIDYSSSFFSGLTGRKRSGEPITKPDYNSDGRVSYAEAHAFAKIDSKTIDIPVSTSEIWLERQISAQQRQHILSQPLDGLLRHASPERSQVVKTLAKQFHIDLRKSFNDNRQQNRLTFDSEELAALYQRLAREIVTVGAEKILRTSNNPDQMALLNRLQRCEAGSIGQI